MIAIRKLIQFGALTIAAMAIGGAGRPVNWNNTIAQTALGSHILGNPAAKVKLTEFVSYTCPHCSDFETHADGPLRIGYVRSGQVSVEVRHIIRDPIDLTVAMLTNCGPKEKFFLNHAAFMRSQATWIRPLVTSTPAQRQRWFAENIAQRNRAIASDFHFYEIMATRGYDRVTVDRCLTDNAMANRIGQQSQNATDVIGVDSTPSFTLNGLLLSGTHEWSLLEPQIRARL